MTNTTENSFEYVWDCREIPIGHSPKVRMQKAQLKGLPNYHAQREGYVAVTICKECVHHVPGRLITIPSPDLENYFAIRDIDVLFSELPDGFAASGASRKRRRKLIEYSMTDPYNPGQNHAGKTLQYAYAFQKDRDRLKPSDADNE